MNDIFQLSDFEISIVLDKNRIHTLICKYHNGGEDKLALFTPYCPENQVFNAYIADQLSHCVTIPRITKPMKAKKYNTTFAMVQCHSSFSGVDTMNITTKSDFSKSSELLSQHEDASIIGREDIKHLLYNKVRNKEITQELADTFISNANARYSKHTLLERCQGSTYVGFQNIIKIQLFEASHDKEIAIIIDDENQQEKEVSVKRSWSIVINILQTEDCEGYGTQF